MYKFHIKLIVRVAFNRDSFHIPTNFSRPPTTTAASKASFRASPDRVTPSSFTDAETIDEFHRFSTKLVDRRRRETKPTTPTPNLERSSRCCGKALESDIEMLPDTWLGLVGEYNDVVV